jgi:hypothetical protein
MRRRCSSTMILSFTAIILSLPGRRTASSQVRALGRLQPACQSFLRLGGRGSKHCRAVGWFCCSRLAATGGASAIRHFGSLAAQKLRAGGLVGARQGRKQPRGLPAVPAGTRLDPDTHPTDESAGLLSAALPGWARLRRLGQARGPPGTPRHLALVDEGPTPARPGRRRGSGSGRGCPATRSRDASSRGDGGRSRGDAPAPRGAQRTVRRGFATGTVVECHGPTRLVGRYVLRVDHRPSRACRSPCRLGSSRRPTSGVAAGGGFWLRLPRCLASDTGSGHARAAPVSPRYVPVLVRLVARRRAPDRSAGQPGSRIQPRRE